MEIDKDDVVDLLRARGEHDRAQQIGCALPQQVDPERDASLLHAVEVNTSDLVGDLAADPDVAGEQA